MDTRVVAITGAGSGLGASLAKKYYELGYYVCLLGRTRTKLLKTAQSFEHRYAIYEVDVSSKSDVSKVMQAIKQEVGQIDVFINNAGVGDFDSAEHISEQAIHQMIDINLKGTIFCTQEVVKDMKKRDQGCIINIISLSGKRGKINESVYSASKFGARGFTESLALELEQTKVKVFGAYMGNMKTELWDGAKAEESYMDPDDVADIIIENTIERNNMVLEEIIIKNNKYKYIQY
ncbi:SDR family oxidoreductase [Lysinibacillus sp. FSL K6-0232]|uniref:SDR family oxidoreductase n=1 Tax=Lysinibacillus sp. FSL K6-0232 TaxID=2921425 RepID=UPI0030F9403E